MRLASAVALSCALLACSDDSRDRHPGQTVFTSAPPVGQGGGGAPGPSNGEGDGGAGSGSGASGGTTTGTPRDVEETDLYRLDGNRLYYLNGYRGLMVFDVTNPDHPALLGRSPIFGSPVDMIVRDGVATVVVADWYGTMDDGTPFYGSIVRGLDATDPTNIKVLGEAKLGGWVRDDRVVGDVLYAVSEDYGWEYGWGYYDGVSSNQETVIVSSVSFANKQIQAVGHTEFTGYAGVFNVTPASILMAHQVGDYNSNQTELVYLDISDPAGSIMQRGAITVSGTVNGWGADNGRWNLDFADAKIAHVIGQKYDGSGGYLLSTVNFSTPDAPQLVSTLDIPTPGWSVAARFDSGRMYLSPSDGWYDGTDTTPFQVYDLTDMTAPKLAGTVTLSGEVWNILPAPQQRMFALGSDYNSNSNSVSLQYIDVTDVANPKVLGTSQFGQGWAWTPAAGTFKAFTMDATKGLVVLPFSGWDYTDYTYNNGLQLIEFTPTTQTLAGTAHTHGWVERGIFVGNRLVSLSDLALSVVDYTDPMNPSVVTELTLARNVITAQPSGETIAEISSDWWDNDVSTSEVRILPIANVEETTDNGTAPTVTVDGIGAQVFMNGTTAYIVTSVRTDQPCPGSSDGSGCYARAQQVQVVDLSNGQAVLRGKVQLPIDQWNYWGWGWGGCWYWDWWWGGEVVQVGGDALAFRRWEPVYDASGNYLDANSKLYVVDASKADSPTIASVTITTDPDGWWGNMQVVGNTLYTTHYEWNEKPDDSNQGWVSYYIDGIDLSDRTNPQIGAKINVPGLLVGGDANDPSTIYTIDYRWDGNIAKNDFDILHIDGDTATLQSATTLDGWVGQTFVRGHVAYMSAQQYDYTSGTAQVQLHAIDVSDPNNPVDRVASDPNSGWGWLLDVEGDRALVTSGWGAGGLDIYKIADGQTPQFDQTIRTRGWWVNGVSRQHEHLFLSSGYWGVQKIDLN